MQELRQSSDTQIKSVLNEDQQKNFDKMREEQQDRMKQWHNGEAITLLRPELLRTVSSKRRRTSDIGPLPSDAGPRFEVRFSPQASELGNSFASPARVARFRGPLFWPMWARASRSCKECKPCGDSRSRLSGGANARAVSGRALKSVELRSAGQPRAAVPRDLLSGLRHFAHQGQQILVRSRGRKSSTDRGWAFLRSDEACLRSARRLEHLPVGADDVGYSKVQN